MSDLKETIKEVTAKLIGVLSPRNKDVIARRFGLKTGQKETLESIGQSYGITRERVRQIEEVSLKQLRAALASGAAAKVRPLVDLAQNVLDQTNGVLREDEFLSRFFNSPLAGKSINGRSRNDTQTMLLFLLNLDGRLQRSPEDDDFHTFLSLSHQHANTFRESIRGLVKALSKNAAPVQETELADFSKKSGAASRYTAPAVLASAMAVSKEIGKNIFGHVGLTNWPEIRPRGVRDKAYLVLKKNGQPQHFRNITRLINEMFPDRRANVQTVHNELIKDARFVLVGRGLYGLSERGYKAGTVKDVLIDLLKHSERPLKRDEIISQVLNHRLVKENTIVLNLQDSRVFNKTENGYTLREA